MGFSHLFDDAADRNVRGQDGRTPPVKRMLDFSLFRTSAFSAVSKPDAPGRGIGLVTEVGGQPPAG
jgi:hypothetical protein